MLASYEICFGLGDINVVAVLSTTILNKNGIYLRTALEGATPERISSLIRGVPHYIGHPTTKEIVESLGAVQAPEKLFKGLNIGESALCFPIAQGKSNRKENGFTVHQEVDLEDLEIVLLTRLA